MEVQLIYLLVTITVRISCILPEKSFDSFGDLHISMFGDTTNDPNLVHFENEQSFIDRFGEDPRIAKMFNKTSPRTHNEDIPGDMGIPVFVENPTEKVRKIIKDGYNLYGYNKYVSDLIPIERRLPDRRNEWYAKLFSLYSFIILSEFNQGLYLINII